MKVILAIGIATLLSGSALISGSMAVDVKEHGPHLLEKAPSKLESALTPAEKRASKEN